MGSDVSMPTIWSGLGRVAAAILLGGCGSSGGSATTTDAQASPPVVHDVKQRTSITGLSLPVDSFKPSPDQVLVINQATTSLVNSCMQRLGFNSVLPPASKSAPETLARRYGVTDAKIAATYGYHLAPSEGVVADRKTNPTTPMSTSEMMVLTGSPNVGAPGATPKASNRTYNGQQVPVGGCLGEANTKLGNGSKYEFRVELDRQDRHRFIRPGKGRPTRRCRVRQVVCPHEAEGLRVR
jgi:hypothetical protein